jgi:hypothetical protein
MRRNFRKRRLRIDSGLAVGKASGTAAASCSASYDSTAVRAAISDTGSR